MKRNFTCNLIAALLLCCSVVHSQNVGIATTAPTEKLSITGNLLVSQPVIISQGQPDASHIRQLVNNVDTALLIIDSAYRLYDPGGTGNYAPNTTAAAGLYDTTNYISGGPSGGLQLSFDSINLGTGDSIYIISQEQFLFKGGSNLNGTHPSITGNFLTLLFISNADASVGPGFSAVVRKLYIAPGAAGSAGTTNYGNTALFFNTANGSFKAGSGNGNNSGSNSFEIGTYCTASSSGAGAMGYSATASGSNAIAIGNSSQATGNNATAIGGAKAPGVYSVGLGIRAAPIGDFSIAVGPDSRSDGYESLSTPGAYAKADNSIALGYGSTSSGNNSVAIASGYTGTTASYGVSIGYGSNAGAGHALSFGKNSGASGTSSTAIGEGCKSYGTNSTTLGYNASASGVNAVALGSSYADGYGATAMGTSSAGGLSSTAIGFNCNSNGQASVAIGNNSSTNAAYSMAIGNYVQATGTNSTAMGNYCSTSGFNGSFAIGDNSTTTVMQTYEDNAFRARFAKGFRFYTTSAVTIGAYLNQGANSWAALSDVRMKEKFLPVNGELFLKNIETMKLTTWNYKGQDAATYRHYGPMAQDFFAAFGKDALGTIGCDTLINQQDFLGVNLIAIQALIQRTNQLTNTNTQLKQTNSELKQQLAVLQQKMDVQNELIAAKLQQLEMMVLAVQKEKEELAVKK